MGRSVNIQTGSHWLRIVLSVPIAAVGTHYGQRPERANCRLRNTTRTRLAGAVSPGPRSASRLPTAEVGTMHCHRAPRCSHAKRVGGDVRRPITLNDRPDENIQDPAIILREYQSIKPLPRTPLPDRGPNPGDPARRVSNPVHQDQVFILNIVAQLLQCWMRSSTDSRQIASYLYRSLPLSAPPIGLYGSYCCTTNSIYT